MDSSLHADTADGGNIKIIMYRWGEDVWRCSGEMSDLLAQVQNSKLV